MAAEGKRDTAGGCNRRVAADHRASFTDALIFSAGDRLAVEARETVWEGWTWCVDGGKTGAWVPDTFIERHGDSCVALRDYDSSELRVNTGDILEVMEEAAGWLWCVDRTGARGWVPAVCVELYDGT
jgi:hypothetical protein